MKRRVGLILLLLVLGAIINVAVAWASAIAVVRDFDEEHARCWDGDEVWQVSRWDTMASTLIQSQRYLGNGRPDDCQAVHALLPSAWVVEGTWPPKRTNDWRSSTIDMHGWPLLSMCSFADQDLGGGPNVIVSGFTIQTQSASRFPTVIPTQPIWHGFAINTAFYALILWLPFAAPFALRWRLRIKRGLCPKCAYDLRGSASQTCPECGKPVAGASVESLP